MEYLPDMDYFPAVAIYGDAGSLSPSESPVISVTAARGKLWSGIGSWAV